MDVLFVNTEKLEDILNFNVDSDELLELKGC